MDYGRMNTLLDKYWECATSVEEERELRRFFTTEVVPPELQPYKGWFVSGEAEDLSPLGSEFDRQILERIAGEKRWYRHRYLTYCSGLLLFLLSALLLIFLLR